MVSLEKENEKIANITASDLVYETKRKEALLFKKFKNKETANIIETNKVISNNIQGLNNTYKNVTGYDISQSDKVNELIEDNLQEYESRLKDIAGIGFDEVYIYKTKSNEKA